MVAQLQSTIAQGNWAALGFGCMRLPTLGNKQEGRETPFFTEHLGDIDLDQFCAMVDVFLAAGFSYFDTARGYHLGQAEGALKRALVERYPRESFRLATKLPAYLAPTAAAAERMFFISLEDTRAEYFDYYLLHNLGGSRTGFFEKFGIWDFVREQQAYGLIERIGFSFHGTPEELEQLLDTHTFVDFVQLQINYLDWDDALIQAKACYEVARSHECEIVVMEPLKGGLLAELPMSVKSTAEPKITKVAALELAFGFAASLPGVATVLSGMSSLEQMQQNTALMLKGRILTQKDKDAIASIKHTLRQKNAVSCTNCAYCREVCPQGVYIPQILQALNSLTLFEDDIRARQAYLWAAPGKASLCIQCGACEAVCPQRIPLVKVLHRAAMELEDDVYELMETTQ